MNRFNKFLVAAFMSAAMLLPNTAQAMEIRQFDKMAQDDRAEYVSELISGAEKVLTGQGRADQAKNIENLFTTNAPNSNVSIGMSQFIVTLAMARLTDAKNVEKDPSAARIEVEDAMALSLEKNDGIKLPDSFFTAANGFRPKYPPKQ